MKIIGIGTDIISVARVARLLSERGQTAQNKLFTDSEVEYCSRFVKSDERYAGRYAAKEAVAKALGTGFTGGVSFRDIEVISQPDGSPQILLHGKTAEIAQQKGVKSLSISISHESDYSVAFAIAVGED